MQSLPKDFCNGGRMLWMKLSFTLIVVVASALAMDAGTTPLLNGTPRVRAQQPKPEPPASPRLAALEREVLAGNKAAVQQFWEEVKNKAPLIETIPNDEQFRRVTFLWRGGDEAREIRLTRPVPLELRQRPMLRLAGTDVWFLSIRLPGASRFGYSFWGGDGKLMSDPLNPQKSGVRSLVELPDAPKQPWILVKPDVPKGSITPGKLKSEILKEERGFSVYTPAGYDSKKGTYGLLVLFDGEAYRNLVPTPTILDNLVAEKKIKPLLALLVDSGKTRSRDLQCSAPFADFLAKELLPWARQHYRFSTDPKQIIVGGSSYGGLSAAYCAFRHPAVFGNVLSQSGSFGYYPGWGSDDETDSAPFGWLIRHFVTTRKLAIRFYLEAGLLETGSAVTILHQNRRLRDVLEAKGYHVVYSEFAGDHGYNNWRGSLADGLIALAGREHQSGARIEEADEDLFAGHWVQVPIDARGEIGEPEIAG